MYGHVVRDITGAQDTSELTFNTVASTFIEEHGYRILDTISTREK